ncbi:hypothetical protein ERJ75_001298500 [Trypanosoma vivax]|nr:hypothetical protein ERJ75_001298500 [Trypanosoma vivax]
MVWERVGANRPPEHQPEEGARPEREVQREWGRGAGQCTGHRVTVDSGACQRGTWSTQDHMVWERVGANRPPEHQPEEGARPEREVQKGVGKGCGQCTGHRVTLDSGACQRGTWSTQDHMVWERVGANRPPEHQPEEGARPEREVQREWGRGAGQCTGHRVTLDSGACQRGTWSTQDHMVWERVGANSHQNTNLKKAHGRSERCKGSGEGVRTVHGPSRHGRQWSVPTWHMEHSGPYGLGAGGGQQATRTPT